MKGKDYDYILTLKASDYRFANIISILLCVLTIIFFVYFLVEGDDKTGTYIVTISVIIFQLIINYFKKRKGEKTNHNYAFAICFIAWLVIKYNNWMLSVLYLIALFAETQVKFPNEIGANEDGITINSFPKKYFAWNDFTNVLIKENILTLDFKNNKLLQKEIAENVPSNLEREFNEFCRQQIYKTISDRTLL